MPRVRFILVRMARGLGTILTVTVTAAVVAVAGCAVEFDASLLDRTDGAADAAISDAVAADVDVGNTPVPDLFVGDLFMGDGPKPPGTPCTAGSQCAGGHCVDDVCCESACTATCFTCSLGSGKCVAVPAGADPGDDCPAEAPSTCGTDGFCDGAGACRLHPFGVSCGSTVCVGDDGIAGEICDGSGSCTASTTPTSCSPYRCNSATNSCFTSCTDDSTCFRFKCDVANSQCFPQCSSTTLHCQAGHVCLKTKCKKI